MGEIEVIKRKGGTIQLFSRDPFCTIKSATQNISLMGDDNIQLSIISTELLDFEKGDKIIVGGEEYTIRTRVAREMKTDRYYQYDAVFYGVMYELMKAQYRNTDESGKSTSMTFDLTYSIRDFVKVIIYNMNRDYPGLWAFDEANCPDTEPRTISFSRQNCLQVLQSLCSKDNFKLEFRITQNNGVRTIHIGKFGTKVIPPSGSDYFEWGKGGGLFTLKDQKVDDKAIITRLWVEGGTTNIRSDYRDYSERLQLPYPKRMNKNEHTLADGTVIPANSEMIGIDDDTKRYIEDAELAQEIGSEEDSEQYDDIFPKRTGKVTAIVEDDINSFVDDTMDFDLNEKDENGTKYLINGVTAKITFITGRLAGQQFEVKADGGYDHSAKKFTIIPFTDKRGLTIPTTDNEAFRIEVGNSYKITDINLPKSYEDNAEEDLWYAGYDDFKPRTQSRVQYALTFDRSYFLENMPDDSETSVFKVGDYVPVRDVRFGVEKSIRIQKISRNLLVDHDYSLTLSDTTTISISQQTVIDVIEHNKIIEANRLKDLNKARRGWRTTEELRNMVYDTDGYFDPENIRPNSIDTNMLTVGSKSQQFVLIGVVMQANVNGNANRFDASSGILAHLTIDETTIKQWTLGELSVTLSEQGGYYVFAKCSKTGTNGVFVVTQTPYKFEPTEDPNNYYFQIGIISSLYPDDNFRDFVTTYGFTRINGKTITTGEIVTSDGECYLDLDGNRFRIGDATSSIDWNVTARKQLTLHNVRLLSDSGDTSFIGVYRGAYRDDYVYYTGDEVSYSNGAETCTYRYIYPNPTKGVKPTNSTYWEVVAKGQQGQKGDDGLPGEDGLPGKSYYTWIRYADDVNGTGISDNPTGKGFIGFAYNKETPTESNDPKDYKWSDIMGKDGVPGEPGEDGKTLYTWIAYSDNADGNPMYQQPKDTTMYIGIATNKETATESDDPKDYVWSKFKGDDGLPGVPGADGKTSYFHIKYSSVQNPTSASQMTETPSDYIGTYVDYTQADSNDPKKYTWARFKGFNGEDGLPGINGEDGKTSYLHIKYSDNGGLSFTANNGEEPGAYIGQYVDFIQKDSDNPTDYTWSLIKGESGDKGDKGDKGDSPVMVYRGDYSSSKTYYGNKNRLDAVKYNNQYYIARIDAGTFSGVVPTNTSKWNPFGAQFESIATNLLLAEGASIGDWFIQGGKIVSTLGSGNKITLDASMARILIESSRSGGDYSEATTQGSKITIDANNGTVEARSKSNTSRVAYMSPTGIFCNNAETQAVALSTGITRKAAIVGIGYGNVSSNVWDNENMLAGIYGYASNSGNAPEYGGYFQKLMAAGLFLSTEIIDDNDGTTYLSETTSLVIGYSSSDKSVYLPNDGVIGRIIFFKQWWTGSMTIRARSGQKLYDDDTPNDYHKVLCGRMAIAIFTVGYINGVKTSAWLINQLPDLIQK